MLSVFYLRQSDDDLHLAESEVGRVEGDGRGLTDDVKAGSDVGQLNDEGDKEDIPDFDEAAELQGLEIGLQDNIVVQRLDVSGQPVLVGIFGGSGGDHGNVLEVRAVGASDRICPR